MGVGRPCRVVHRLREGQHIELLIRFSSIAHIDLLLVTLAGEHEVAGNLGPESGTTSLESGSVSASVVLSPNWGLPVFTAVAVSSSKRARRALLPGSSSRALLSRRRDTSVAEPVRRSSPELMH